MKKTYFLVLFTLSTLAFSQVKKDSTTVVKDSVKQVQQDVLYTSKDIALIDVNTLKLSELNPDINNNMWDPTRNHFRSLALFVIR